MYDDPINPERPSPTVAHEDREREVSSALTDLSKSTETLIETVNEIERRLEMALRSEESGGEDRAIRGYDTLLAQGISVQSERVQEASSSLRSVLARLEL